MDSQNPEEARHLRALARQISSGNCILVLGPGASTDLQNAKEIPLNNILAKEIAADQKISRTKDLNCCDLRHVSQVKLDQDKSPSLLRETVIEFYDRFAGRTSEFHKNIAALPFQLCITTTPDDFLYKALAECEEMKKTPVREFYNFRKAHPGDVPDPSVSAPIVYYLYGYPEEPLSLVITENDLIDFLTKVIRNEPPLPVSIRNALKKPDNTFLFIDVGFKNWYLRALLWALGLYGHIETSMAIEDPEFFAQSQQHQTMVYYSSSKMIQFQQESLSGFSQKLRKAYNELPEHKRKTTPKISEGAPRVFLSYAHENQDEVERLSEKLTDANIDVWRDKQNLRLGDDWKQKLKYVIAKQADYVVVIQSAEMLRRTKGVFFDEIRQALECQRTYQEGLRFVLPATIGDVENMSLLADLHSHRIDTEDGFNAFTAAIMEDWKERERRKTVE